LSFIVAFIRFRGRSKGIRVTQVGCGSRDVGRDHRVRRELRHDDRRHGWPIRSDVCGCGTGNLASIRLRGGELAA
jgi:hypothetical protein